MQSDINFSLDSQLSSYRRTESINFTFEFAVRSLVAHLLFVRHHSPRQWQKYWEEKDLPIHRDRFGWHLVLKKMVIQSFRTFTRIQRTVPDFRKWKLVHNRLQSIRRRWQTIRLKRQSWCGLHLFRHAKWIAATISAPRTLEPPLKYTHLATRLPILNGVRWCVRRINVIIGINEQIVGHFKWACNCRTRSSLNSNWTEISGAAEVTGIPTLHRIKQKKKIKGKMQINSISAGCDCYRALTIFSLSLSHSLLCWLDLYFCFIVIGNGYHVSDWMRNYDAVTQCVVYFSEMRI